MEKSLSLPVKVVPGSERNEIIGKLGNRLKVKVQAPPEDGKANREVVEFLAQELGVNKQQIQLVFGTSSPEKLLRITPRNLEESTRVQQVLKAWMSL
ncbi:MAG: DUF167 domain-containing protein [Patescibacteria group bacterium]